jgi:hypothetical protein
MLFSDFEGKPHWGQTNRLMNKELLKEMFPEWQSFVKVYQMFNHGDFDGPFTQQVGFRDLISELGSVDNSNATKYGYLQFSCVNGQ